MNRMFTKNFGLLFIFMLALSATAFAQPSNNECANAADLSALFGQADNEAQTSALYTNIDATTEASDPAMGWECFGEPDGSGAMPSLEQTVWFTFTGDGGTYFMETVECNATDYIDDADTQIAIYTGGCDGLMAAFCNEDGPSSTQTTYPAGLEFDTEDGVVYHMLVDGFSFNGNLSDGEFCIQVTRVPPVSLITCADASGGTAGGAGLVCFNESTSFTLDGVIVPTAENAGFTWAVSSEDISNTTDPNSEGSILGFFPTQADVYIPSFLNDGTQVPAGSTVYFTPITFGEVGLDDEGNLNFPSGCVFTGGSQEVVLAPELEEMTAELTINDVDGSASVAVSGGSGAYTYEWSTGATTADVTDLETGTYSVTVSDDTGCVANVVSTFDIVIIATNDLVLGAALDVFPNPATDAVNISYNFNEATDLTINLTNTLGQVMTQKVVSNATKGAIQLDLNNLVEGIYMVQFTDGTRQFSQKLVVRK